MYSRQELKILSSDFWSMFGQRCDIHPLLKHKKKNWTLHQTKISNVALKFETGRKNAKVMIEISHKNESRRLQVYEILEKYKSLIGEGFKDELIWDFCYVREESNREVCRIYTFLDNADFHSQDQWPRIFNFFIENMILLERNFLEVRDLIKEDISKLP